MALTLLIPRALPWHVGRKSVGEAVREDDDHTTPVLCLHRRERHYWQDWFHNQDWEAGEVKRCLGQLSSRDMAEAHRPVVSVQMGYDVFLEADLEAVHTHFVLVVVREADQAEGDERMDALGFQQTKYQLRYLRLRHLRVRPNGFFSDF